ncbi:MAG TPA: DUF6438 domain-containing protein [Terriglobales bacterium]|jgi:hypothetical protein|nr:DUF6438 domain-containing protein [Terriglobales bacterium]
MNAALRWVVLGFVLGSSLGMAQDSNPTIEVLEAETAEHRIGTRGPIYTDLGQNMDPTSLARILEPLTFEVVVGTDGKTLEAQTISGFIFDLTLLWKTWQYKPFERNGHQVVAKVGESVTILSIQKRSEVHIPFPEIHDWNSLRITLRRSACYGICPTYRTEIHGDGTVLYNGEANVGTTGEKKLKISQPSLVQLVDAFRKADYFSLADGYVSGITDMPTYASSISFDGQSKSVLDYVGRSLGMPPAVSNVEEAIDRLSGASKLIRQK